jgi:hypothetical protein
MCDFSDFSSKLTFIFYESADFFFVKVGDGWKKMVLPNDAEVREYGNGQPLQGIVSLRFTGCGEF